MATLSETRADIIIRDELENVIYRSMILTIAEGCANGLLDYTNLSEFQKNLIDSKRRLATVPSAVYSQCH